MSVPDFDEFSSAYRDIHDVNLRISGARSGLFARQKAEILADREGRGAGIYWLDLGCGDASTLAFLSALMPSARFTGVDPSPGMISAAGAMNITRADFAVADASSLPYPDSHFDAVLLANVLHHIDPGSRAAVLAETGRVLKTGGRLYVFEHNPMNPFTRYLVNTCPFDKGVKLVPAGKLFRTLRMQGFNVKNREYINFFPPGRNGERLAGLQKLLSFLPLGAQYLVCAVKDVSGPASSG